MIKKLKHVENMKKVKMQKTFAPAISIWVLVMVLNNNYVDYKLTNFALIRVIIQIAIHG